MIETHTVRAYRDQAREYRAYAERQSDYTIRMLMLRLAEDLERRGGKDMA
jgi:hypothetical protein